ncbi:MAG: hypothetical protein E7Z96_02740 [Actinomycetaceae bacterium]|nr:hypothetical protein [Actinomycetaceae bacterium]
MARTSVTAGAIDRALAAVFTSEMIRQGVSYRTVSAQANLAPTRVYLILAAQRPFYARDVVALAEALGLPMATVVKRAQQQLTP